MHSKHQNSPVQRQALGESAFDSEKSQSSGVQTQSPPAFSLGGESMQLTAATATPSATTAGPIQRTAPKIRKPDRKDAEYGPAETGPITHQGAGDAHAVDRTDVNQGALGDCWLLASLMALADSNPDLIQNAITDKGDGTYDVKLYKKKGLFKKTFEAQTINVTSEFVVSKVTGGNYYARGGDMDNNGNTEMWVRLIEKAYAQMKGSYNAIHGGWEENALETLTGKEHSSHGFGNGFLGIGATKTADLKASIIAALDAGQPMTASTKSQGAIDKADKNENNFAANNDIVGHHAYSVVSANDNNITVRNPWGRSAATAEPTLTWAQFRAFYRDYTTED